MSSSPVIVSNRLPITIEEDGGELRAKPSSGGLVTVLTAALRGRHFTWIGWAGTDAGQRIEEALAKFAENHGFTLLPVHLTAHERSHFYSGFCNEILWPLFHDLQSRCNFDPAYWQAYQTVNRRFAETLEQDTTQDRGLVWIHDYHLLLVAAFARARGISGAKFSYFHHIPFPPPDIFCKLPWRTEVLTAMFSFDLIGFQTQHDQRNFVACVRQYLEGARVQSCRDGVFMSWKDRITRLGVFPIGIDAAEFLRCAEDPSVVTRIREIRQRVGTEHIIVGVDRLDYTKGIPERLRAYAMLLEQNPELHGKVTLLQAVVPSRSDIPKYNELELEVERLVSHINGRYGQPGWVPVEYLHRHFDRLELVALYRAADIGLVTPLRDGMNLVAKEFCAVQVENSAVLILSEFAGAARELGRDALMVNPYDMAGVAAALLQACQMPAEQKQKRMRRMRTHIMHSDVHRWFGNFVSAASSDEACPSGEIPPESTHPQPFIR